MPPAVQWVEAWPRATTSTRAPAICQGDRRRHARRAPHRRRPRQTDGIGRLGAPASPSPSLTRSTATPGPSTPAYMPAVSQSSWSWRPQAIGRVPRNRSARKSDEGPSTGSGSGCSPARPARRDPGRPERAEAALAGPHPEPCAPPDIVEAARPVLVEEVIEDRPGHQFALADQVGVASAGASCSASR